MGGKRMPWNDEPQVAWSELALGCLVGILATAGGIYLWFKVIEWVVAVHP